MSAETFLHIPDFKNLVRNWFVRVEFPITDDAPISTLTPYELATIVSAVNGPTRYRIGMKYTRMLFLINNGESERLIRISDAALVEVTIEELTLWRDRCRKNSVLLPTRSLLETREEQMLISYAWTVGRGTVGMTLSQLRYDLAYRDLRQLKAIHAVSVKTNADADQVQCFKLLMYERSKRIIIGLKSRIMEKCKCFV